jgi:D-alanine-D-alanine ligase
MLIGLTYDLRDEYLRMGYSEEETAEFDREDTIISIENTLVGLGYQTDRIGNIMTLVNRLSCGDRWDMVFNIAEGLYGSGREAQVPALLDAYRIPYVFSGPLVLLFTQLLI